MAKDVRLDVFERVYVLSYKKRGRRRLKNLTAFLDMSVFFTETGLRRSHLSPDYLSGVFLFKSCLLNFYLNTGVSDNFVLQGKCLTARHGSVSLFSLYSESESFRFIHAFLLKQLSLLLLFPLSALHHLYRDL